MSAAGVPTLSLEGKVALITGGARGIGKAIAWKFAQAGARLVLLDLLEEVRRVAEEFSESGHAAVGFQTDISNRSDVERIVQESIGQLGRIDILVNNAGVALLEEAERLSESDWSKTLDVNLSAPFWLSQAVGHHMIRQAAGSIVNIASQAALIALPRHAAYCASKAGLVALTKVLALEWAKYGIRVNAIAPTVVLTELGREAWAGPRGEEMMKRIPLGRFAYPDEIAWTALFLASDAAGMITGETVVVDGGFTIQ